MNIAFFGSSLVSAYWNGAATYYRGLLRALARARPRVTFYEPDAFERQQHRDIADPPTGRGSWSIPATERRAAQRALERRRGADLVVKASGVGVFDEPARSGRAGAAGGPTTLVASGTWTRRPPWTACTTIRTDPFAALIPRYDLSAPTAAATRSSTPTGARRARLRSDLQRARPARPTIRCRPSRASQRDLGFLGNRLPDREARVEEFFLNAARAAAGTPLPARRQRLGRQAACRPTSATSATSTPPTTTRSTARRWRCSTSAATAWPRVRLLAGHARVRGGGRRRLPHHRRLGRHRAVPRARTRRSWWRDDGDEVARTCVER